MEQKRYYKTTPNSLPQENDALDWEDEFFYPGISSVASAQECTGMMPIPPEDEEQEDAYRSLFSNELPKGS